jgi:hypothetical protein
VIYKADDIETLEKAVTMLTLLIVFVFDPLAILLVVAANMQMKELRNESPARKPLSKLDNVTKIDNDWNPANWFKIVNSPKNPDS